LNSFEYITVLVSIVVGLAIADLATSAHRLLRAGGRVRWDWIAPTAALLMLLELFNLWWKWHGFTGTTLGQVVPYFATLLLLFLSASAALPDEVPAEGLDLREFFHENRRYFWSVYTAYVASWIGLRSVQASMEGVPIHQIIADKSIDYLTIGIYFGLIFVRRPIFSGIALASTLVWLIYDWWMMPLAGVK
jgi:hypothetical protein